MSNAEHGGERVLIAHAPMLRIVRNRWIMPTIRRIEKVYGNLAAGYAALSPEKKEEAFVEIALGMAKAPGAAVLPFWTGERDAIPCVNPAGPEEPIAKLELLSNEDLLYEEDCPPLEDDPFYRRHDPYEKRGSGVFHLDPVFATALIAISLTDLVPTMLPWEACGFALTGVYPDTREMLLEPLLEGGTELRGFSLFIERLTLGKKTLEAIQAVDKDRIRISINTRHLGEWKTGYEVQAIGELVQSDLDNIAFILGMSRMSMDALIWEYTARDSMRSVAEGVIDWCKPKSEIVKRPKPKARTEKVHDVVEEMIRSGEYRTKKGEFSWTKANDALQKTGIGGYPSPKDLKKTYNAVHKRLRTREALPQKSFVMVPASRVPKDGTALKAFLGTGLFIQATDQETGEPLGYARVEGYKNLNDVNPPIIP